MKKAFYSIIQNEKYCSNLKVIMGEWGECGEKCQGNSEHQYQGMSDFFGHTYTIQ
jgi:hypothetical protein